MPSSRSGASRASQHLPHVAGADAALLDRPVLTPTQRENLLTWAEPAATSRDLDGLVDEHSVPLNATAWREHLSRVPGLLDAVTETGRVSRRDVNTVAADCERAEEWTPLLIASFAWGQGTNGYGPRRLSDIRAHAATQRLDLDKTLAGAVAAMRAGTAADAYAHLRGAIRGLGPAFFTKFLYFAGTQVSTAEGPAPLILDAVVAGRVRTVAAARAAAVGIPDPEALCAWLWTPTGWTPHRYAVWLDYAQEATHQLATAKTRAFTWPSRTDLFELAVFRGKLIE